MLSSWVPGSGVVRGSQSLMEWSGFGLCEETDPVSISLTLSLSPLSFQKAVRVTTLMKRLRAPEQSGTAAAQSAPGTDTATPGAAGGAIRNVYYWYSTNATRITSGTGKKSGPHGLLHSHTVTLLGEEVQSQSLALQDFKKLSKHYPSLTKQSLVPQRLFSFFHEVKQLSEGDVSSRPSKKIFLYFLLICLYFLKVLIMEI